jgi:hypothetical protein
MKKILFLLVAVIFCLPIEANPPHNLHQFAIGAENYNKHEQWQVNRKASGTALWTSKWKTTRDDYEKVLPKAGAKSIHVTSITHDESTGLATVHW